LSKKIDSILLLPGPDGWELWQGTHEQGFSQILESHPNRASELEKIPAGNLLMGFPIREALAIPFKVQTDDESMFEDLAAMQMEKIGVRPEVDAGQLTDVFSAGHANGETTLLSVVLAPPEEGSMPPRAPSEFDISARFFPMVDNAVTLWCELGRWVFAVVCGGRLTYFQSLPGTGVTGDAVRDVKLALNQLRLQGVSLNIEKAIVWGSGGANEPSEEMIRDFSKSLGVSVSVEPKPSPVPPRPISKLVPADVRAEQRMKAERIKRNLGIAAIVLVYLGLVAYFGYEYWQVNQDLKNQTAELESIRVEHGDIGIFNDEWDQLAPVVDSQRWPLNVLFRSASLIPLRQDLRFTHFEAEAGHVTIRGEAADIKQTSAYAEKLRRGLSDFDWNLPPAEPDAKTNRWKFNYEGTLKGGELEL